MENYEKLALVRKKLEAKGWKPEDINEVCGHPLAALPPEQSIASDGDGSMDPMTAAKIVKFLVSKLTPDDRAELDEMLGGEAPDLAQDVKSGSLAMDRAPAFVKRQVSQFSAHGQASRRAEAEADFAKRFPDAALIGETR